MLNLYLIRHAESKAQLRPEIVCGRSDHVALTPIGKMQAEALGKQLKQDGVSFDKVYTSTAIRARETAEIAMSEMEFPLTQIQSTDKLCEISKGNWEGQERAKVCPPSIRRQMHWGYKHPDGESNEDVEERMHRFVENELIPQCAGGRDIHVAVFTHKMAIKAFLRRIMNATTIAVDQMVIDNTSVTHLQFNPHWRFRGMQQAEHLRVLGLKH